VDIIYSKQAKYRCVEESKIETANSTVYQAQDLELGRTVCVKIIRFTGTNNALLPAELNRAMLEVKALVALSEQTTHVPVVYDVFFDEKSGELSIVMQWIHGDTLEKQFDHIPPVAFLGYIEKLCDILEKLEKLHMSHKDIKPANVMITQDRELFLIDFNLSISAPNQAEGTKNYKAPEMDTRSKTTRRDRVDIFSVGVMMYQYFTKTIPLRGVNYGIRSRRSKEILQQTWDFFQEPKEFIPDLHPEINDVIVKCMQLDPKQRYANARQLKRAVIAARKAVINGSRK
jgi:serine/threonine protein kinase